MGQNGTALVCALMVTALLGTLGAAVVLLATIESLISANHRDALDALYAADAGVERTIGELRTLDDWEEVPRTAAGTATTDFRDGAIAPRLPDGTILDLARLTAERQAHSDDLYGAEANRPIWRLFAHAPISRLLPAGLIQSPAYVVLWIADDVGDGDGDPLRDSNQVLMVHSEAFGPRGVRRRVEATLARASLQRTEVQLICWREVQ